MDSRKKSDASQVTIKKEDPLVFTIQIAAIFLVIIISLINITLGIGKQEIWLAVFAWAIGFILPAPKLNTTFIVPDSQTFKATDIE